MTTASPGPLWRRPDSWAAIAAVLLLAGFVIAFAARQMIVLSTAGYDDALFIALGRSLATGHWLGAYNDLTLAKGPGFPAFLAAANVLGLPFTLALGLFYAGCAGFAALVLARVTQSRWAAVALLAALLFVPTLSDGEMLRVTRDLFYSGLVVAFASAAIALASGVLRPSGPLIAATGLLGAWAWVTREEGVWLAPLAVLALIPALRRDPSAASGVRAIATRLRPLAIAAAVGVGAVVGFGLINWAVYGRFVVNELKDGAFAGALSALQDASAPYHKTGVPVPAAARARIYAVSPAFAELKEPTLDGPMQAQATQAGCDQDKAFCGDFGGGWFLWYLRTTAMQRGHHASAPEAASFYRELARQVRGACADGRLTCQHWRVPLVPPMTGDEVDDVARSFVRVADGLSFGFPPNVYARQSDLSGPNADRMVRFLNGPQPPQAGRIKMQGWYRPDGAAWFSIGGDNVGVIAFQRLDSPDVAGFFNDPRLSRQRFTLEVQCPPGSGCPVLFTPEGGAPIPLDLAALARGGNHVGAAELFLDSAGDEKVTPLLKERLAEAWTHLAARLTPAYRGLVAIGLLAYGAVLVLAVRRRKLPPVAVICGALLLAVAARTLILALVDALSFHATSNAYALPGALLLVMSSVYAIHAALKRPGA